jgi:uncharacterized membrane protein YraQ (UPF0718 family)
MEGGMTVGKRTYDWVRSGVSHWQDEWKPLAIMVAVFITLVYLPIGVPRFENAVLESLALAQWYAQEHVLLCLLPAFLIAGAIAVFVSQGAVMKYLGADAPKVLAYGVASVSGTILAVCSCTVLPLFGGIYRRGAGLGPAVAFLYSGPAINVLAIVLTANVLGVEMGVARAVGAICFSIVIGLLMSLIFRQEEQAKQHSQMAMPEPDVERPLWQNGVFFASLVGILVFANWGQPQDAGGVWAALYQAKWGLTSGFALVLAIVLVRWFGVRWWQMASIGLLTVFVALMFPSTPSFAFVVGLAGLSLLLSVSEDELGEWWQQSWEFAKQILPLLFWGVLIAGLLLGRPGEEGIMPSEWVSAAVGGNSLLANVTASFLGAFMYFATLTEVPILQGLMGNGMGKGPALALLLAGPALSLPNMLVIRSMMGTKKTFVFVVLVVSMSTVSGVLFGTFFG